MTTQPSNEQLRLLMRIARHGGMVDAVRALDLVPTNAPVRVSTSDGFSKPTVLACAARGWIVVHEIAWATQGALVELTADGFAAQRDAAPPRAPSAQERALLESLAAPAPRRIDSSVPGHVVRTCVARGWLEARGPEMGCLTVLTARGQAALAEVGL